MVTITFAIFLFTTQKMETADLVTFTEEIFNEKHFFAVIDCLCENLSWMLCNKLGPVNSFVLFSIPSRNRAEQGT